MKVSRICWAKPYLQVGQIQRTLTCKVVTQQFMDRKWKWDSGTTQFVIAHRWPYMNRVWPVGCLWLVESQLLLQKHILKFDLKLTCISLFKDSRMEVLHWNSRVVKVLFLCLDKNQRHNYKLRSKEFYLQRSERKGLICGRT
jgi:hypothetical protein